MGIKIAHALIAGAMFLTGAAPANAAPLPFRMTGIFDLNLGGMTFNDVYLTLSGTGSSALGLTTDEGNPFIMFSSLNAIVSGYGTFMVPSSIVFYYNPNSGVNGGEGGFIDYSTGQKVMTLQSPSFIGYDGNSSLITSGLTFQTAAGFSTPFGTAEVLSANDLVLAMGVPEPAAWGMMIIGFGAAGAAMRRTRSRALRTDKIGPVAA